MLQRCQVSVLFLLNFHHRYTINQNLRRLTCWAAPVVQGTVSPPAALQTGAGRHSVGSRRFKLSHKQNPKRDCHSSTQTTDWGADLTSMYRWILWSCPLSRNTVSLPPSAHCTLPGGGAYKRFHESCVQQSVKHSETQNKAGATGRQDDGDLHVTDLNSPIF